MPKNRQWIGFTCAIVPAAALAADSASLSPGRWSETVRTHSGSIGGRALTGDQLGSEQTTVHICISEEDAADPKRYFAAYTAGGECSAPAGIVADGRIDLSATCGGMAMRMTGTYGGDRFDGAVTAAGRMNGQAFELTKSLEGRRVGVCDGSEQ